MFTLHNLSLSSDQGVCQLGILHELNHDDSLHVTFDVLLCHSPPFDDVSFFEIFPVGFVLDLQLIHCLVKLGKKAVEHFRHLLLLILLLHQLTDKVVNNWVLEVCSLVELIQIEVIGDDGKSCLCGLLFSHLP